MKRLLLSFLFIVLAFFIVDRLGGKVMWWINQHTQDIMAPKLRYLANAVDEDIILLGTSRCNFHYVPSILADSLDMSVYNGGIDASNCIYAHYFVLNQILRHHIPKVVCLELMTNDYICSDDSFETTSFFAPYMGRCANADSIFRHAGNYWTYRLSHLYRYNAKAVSNIGGLLINKQSSSDNGYIPLSRSGFNPENLQKVQTSSAIDSLKIQYVQKFIDICKDNKIKVVFMVSPAYTIADQNLYDALKNIAKEYQVPFFDYHTTGLFLDHPEYFRDEGHLWDEGARVYSAIFAQDLGEILQEGNE